MIRFLFSLAIIFLFDLYVFGSLRKQLKFSAKWLSTLIMVLYWFIVLFYYTSPLIIRHLFKQGNSFSDSFFLYFSAGFILFYFPKFIIMIFRAIEDTTKIIAWITKKFTHNESKAFQKAEGISRSQFLSRIGIFISAIPFTSIIYSIAKGRFNFELKKKVLYFDHLPKAFDGYRIVQFSDFHAGSLSGLQYNFQKAFDLINEQSADIIVFTGDMVNNSADELEGWIDKFIALKAKDGKFSILGNHDYGSYWDWENEDSKNSNFEKLKIIQSKMGFNLLMNDSVLLEKDGEKIALIGVENWGEKKIRRGDLDVAMQKTNEIPFKILLSHDPTHWDYAVNGKTDIALTLSGHTHGIQLAFNWGNYSWSPVSYGYKRWKGLYTENNQHLYVNIGLGYIYFPGRIGADPEITLFELKSK